MFALHRFAALAVLMIVTCVASLPSTEYLAEHRLTKNGDESATHESVDDPSNGANADELYPDVEGVDYFYGIGGIPGGLLQAVDGGSGISEEECPWSKTGVCLCGRSTGGSWEFSCPSKDDDEFETDDVRVNFDYSTHMKGPGGVGAGGTNDTSSGNDDLNVNSPPENPGFRGYYFHSYPVTITFQPEVQVLIKCSLDATPDDFRYLKDHDLKKVSGVEFYSCPPPSPKDTYSSLIASMGIPLSELKYLVIHDVTRGGFRSSSFNSSSRSSNDTTPKMSAAMFEGLSNLTQLSVRTAGVDELPSNLLSGFPHLGALDLAENGLTSLPADLLKAAPQLTMLDLRSNRLEEIPDGFFGESKALETLYLNGNRLKGVNSTAFVGLGKLGVLELRSNRLGPTIAKSVLDAVPSLKWLSLANNSLESLPGDLFSATPRIERLIIAMNDKLTELPEGILLPLANLTNLSLDRNGLYAVPERLLENATKLANLTLAGQHLTTIPKGFFKNCQSLERLDLRSNKIAYLPDEAFSGLTSLRHLNLGSNSLEMINEALLAPLSGLEILVLSRNRLTTMAPRALRSNARLTNIDVSDNLLSFRSPTAGDPFASLTPFSACTELRVLNLEKNRIQYIYEEWRITPARLRELRLRYNNITGVSYGDFGFSSSDVTVDLRDNDVETVDFYDVALASVLDHDNDNSGGRNAGGETRVLLSGNPLKCDCDLYRFVKYLTANPGDKRRVIISGGSELKCANPWNLANTTVVRTPLESLTCNVTKDCPSGCSCVNQPHGENVIVSCHDALKGLPAKLPEGTTILRLENNTMTSLSQVLNDSMLTKTLKEVYLGGNRLTTFDLNPDTVPRALSLLDVSFNNLTRMPTESLVRLVQVAPDLSLRLSGNPWACDCETRPFFDFVLEKFTRIKDFDSVRCAGDGRRLSELAPEDLCPEAWRRTVWATSTLGVMFVALLFLTAAYIKYGFYLRAWLYARKWGLPLIALHDKLTRRMEDEEGCSYDAFISYSSKDEDFVVGDLSQGLEHGNPPYKLNLHFRDWKPGEFIQDQVYTAVSQSRRTVVILSNNYVNSVWGRAEFRVAHTRALQDRIDRVVVILYGEMPEKDSMDECLRTYVNLKTYLKWGDALFWERLRYALSRPLTSKKAIDPNASEMGIVNKGLETV